MKPEDQEAREEHETRMAAIKSWLDGADAQEVKMAEQLVRSARERLIERARAELNVLGSRGIPGRVKRSDAGSKRGKKQSANAAVA